MIKKILLALLTLSFLMPNLAVAQEQEAPEATSAEIEMSAEQEQQTMELMNQAADAATAQSNVETDFFLAKVTAIKKEEPTSSPDGPALVQDVTIKATSGAEKGQEINIDQYFSSLESRKLKVGDTVVINKTKSTEQTSYYVADKYRLPPSIVVALIFFGFVIVFARWKGLYSILGLFFSLAILMKVVVPPILTGTDPMLMSIVGALLIAVVSLYLAHGFNRRTSISLLSTLITLAIAIGLSLIFVTLSQLSGTGSEEALYLLNGPAAKIDLRGLLLGGIIIGALGVLDDITTSQVAAVAEIHRANPKLSFQELYRSGINVGREHIASLVNTLVLAYVGASFPLFLLFHLSTDSQPIWVTLNSEYIMEEVIRTLVGSSALIFAVPIATFLATYFFIKMKPEQLAEADGHGHHHH